MNLVGGRRPKKVAHSRGVRQGSANFYRGRTTVTLSDSNKRKKQKEYRRKNLTMHRRAELAAFIKKVVKFSLLAIIILATLNSLRIGTVVVDTRSQLSNEQKSEILKLSDSYLNPLNSLKFVFNQDDYIQYMIDNASFVDSVVVSLGTLGSNLDILVTPKLPLMKLNATSSALESDSLWVAQDGTVIKVEDNEVQPLLDIELINTTGIPYEEGEAILSAQQLSYIRKISEELALTRTVVTSVKITDDIKEFKLGLAGEKYELYVSTDRSIRSTVEDYEVVLDTIGAKENGITSHIDLRITDKVFYR